MSAVLVSCVKSEINQDGGSPESSYLNVYYDDIVFPSKGGEDYFDIESNTDWTISNTSDWLTIEPMEGNGNVSITLTASASNIYDDRNTVITVKAGKITETFTVTQKYAEALLVTKNKFDIPQEGGDFTIEIQSNISYEIQIDSDSQSWISEAPQSKALTTYTHTFSVESNPNTTKRNGSIEIIGSNGKTETVKIYQAQKDELVLSESEALVPAKGGEVRVQLRSNVDYEVIIPEDVDWVELLQSDKADELVFNVKPNDRTEDREAGITVKDKNSDLSQTFTIKQIVGSIILEESYYEVDAKGGSIEVNLSTDIDFEVIIPENIDWVTRIETKSLEKRTFNLNVLPNSQAEEREAEITVKDINSDISQTLTIKQKVGKIIVITEFEVQFKGGTIFIPYISDIECKVIIPESAQSWISVVETKSMEPHSFQLSIAMNEEGNERMAAITIQDINSPLSQDIKITQMAFGYYKGDIRATSEEDLKEIHDAGYTVIDGNAYFNVETLSQLGNLIEEIRGDLELGGNVASLDGLYGLISIGGNLIENSDRLVSFEGLNDLKSIDGNFEVDGMSFKSLKSLEIIGDDFIASNIEDFIGLEQLSTIGGGLYITAACSCEGLSGLQSLNTIEAEKISSFKGLNNLNYVVGDFNITDGLLVDFDGLQNLRKIGGNFYLHATDNDIYTFSNLESFSGLLSLREIGGDFIISASAYATFPCNKLESFKGLESLEIINGNFVINASATSVNAANGSATLLNALKSFEGLTNLRKIEGNFELNTTSYNGTGSYMTISRVLSNLESLKGLDNLTEIGGDFVIHTKGNGVQLSLLAFSEGPENLSSVNGNFYIQKQHDHGYSTISSLEGFRSLEYIKGNLEIDDISSYTGLGNLKCINGDFEITGDTQGMSNLSTIEGNLTVSGETSSINGLTGLSTITGNLSISETSMTAINGVTQLQEVGGDIEISDNSKLEDISGLSGLTNCANISITNSPNLYNFQPLETAARNMTGTWYVYGCGYNPTKYQMLNGESKPQE